VYCVALELRRERQGRRTNAGCSKRKGRPSIATNRLLQQNLHKADLTAGAADVRFRSTADLR